MRVRVQKLWGFGNTNYDIILVFLAQKWCWFIELNLISGSDAGVVTPNDKKCYHFDHWTDAVIARQEEIDVYTL